MAPVTQPTRCPQESKDVWSATQYAGNRKSHLRGASGTDSHGDPFLTYHIKAEESFGSA